MKTQTVAMQWKKDTKWKAVFETDEATAPIKSVYVEKHWLPNPAPKQIKVTVEVA